MAKEEKQCVEEEIESSPSHPPTPSHDGFS
jgi:hypothetical protein